MKCARRVLPVVLSSVLLSGVAAADETIRAPAATTVAIMGDSAQALLWDSQKGEYQLVKAGDHIQGYFVVTIETDHVVVAELDHPKVRHVLELTEAPTSRSGKAPAKPTIITLAPSRGLASVLEVIDPYPSDKLDLLDPYGAPPSKTAPRVRASPVTVRPTVVTVTAPPQSRASVAKPGVSPPSVIGVRPLPAKPDPTPAAEPDEPEGPVEHAVKLERADLDDALSDFDRLSNEVQIQRAKGGGVRITDIKKGSFFYRAGLRKGDVVRTVAGERLTDMASAARVYALVQSSDEFDVEVDRRGRRIIFGFALR